MEEIAEAPEYEQASPAESVEEPEPEPEPEPEAAPVAEGAE